MLRMALQFAVRVDVSHLPGILDPQGVTVERALPALGYDNVSDVRIGKTVHLTVEADSAEAARRQVDETCRQLLANPVIEAYDITIDALAPA